MVSCVELPIASEAKKTHNKLFGKIFRNKPVEEVQKKREPAVRAQRRWVRVVKDDHNVGEENTNPHVIRKFTKDYVEKQQRRMLEAQERIEDDVFNSEKETTEKQQERNRSNSLDRQPTFTKIVNRLFRSKSDSSVKTQNRHDRHSKERKTSADSWTQGVPYSLESCVNTILKKSGSPDSSNDGSGKKCTRFCEEVEILKLDYEDLDKKEIVSEPLHDTYKMCEDEVNEE
ncbi:unnamed protein product [Dimorphilus gyrociliatus]|nr:unnamed protein product [Dimorphilus gyrociliatus]